MTLTHKKIGLAIGTVLAISLLAIPQLNFQREKSRRHHQIGQLWELIKIYYAPTHHGFYPTDLAQLKALPIYSSHSIYFDRALREIDLVAPGINESAVNPATVALREHTADSRGGRWEHSVDGSIIYRRRASVN